MKTLKNLRYDVVCAGGGASGVFAAVAATRTGARVLLLERTGFLGGAAALGMPLRGVAPQHTPFPADSDGPKSALSPARPAPVQ